MMSELTIYHLIQPCKNRGLNLINNGNGIISINGNEFFSSRDAEEYLMGIPRIDI